MWSLKTVVLHSSGLSRQVLLYLTMLSLLNIFVHLSLLNALNTKNFIKVVSPSEFNIVFIKETPTAENLAKLIFQEIDCDVKVKSNHNAILTKIEFWETPTSCAFYSK